MLLAGFGGNLTDGFGGAFSGGSGLGKSANTTDVVDSFTAAWGWGYNTSVAHLYSNSPAGWLRAISNNLYTQANNIGGKVNGKSLIQFADSINDLLKKQWGYGYGGTVVLESNSPASWLQSIKESLGGIQNGSTLSSWVYYIAQKSSSSTGFLNTLVNQGATSSSFFSTGFDDLLSSLSSISGKIGPLQKDSSLSYWVYYIAEKSASSLAFLDFLVDQGVSTSSLLSKGFSDVMANFETVVDRLEALDALGVRLSSIGNQLGDIGISMSSSLKWLEVFHGDLSMLRHGRASISLDEADYTVWDWLHDIDYSLGNVSQLLQGVQETLTAWGNRWDSQDLYLMEWAKRWDARPQPSFSFDDGAILAKLDSIRSLLTVSAAKDVLDGLVGDLNLDATEAASAAVGSAIQNAFPFCVPAVLKQILGLLQADPSPPQFHFDFWGAPLDFGFSDWQGLADMTSWLSRIGFAVVLFANSRRFVYSGGVAGD